MLTSPLKTFCLLQHVWSSFFTRAANESDSRVFWAREEDLSETDDSGALFSRNFASWLPPFRVLILLLWRLRLRNIERSIEAVGSRSSANLSYIFRFRCLQWLNLREVVCVVLVSIQGPTNLNIQTQIYWRILVGVYCLLVCHFIVSSSLFTSPCQKPLTPVQGDSRVSRLVFLFSAITSHELISLTNAKNTWYPKREWIPLKPITSSPIFLRQQINALSAHVGIAS